MYADIPKIEISIENQLFKSMIFDENVIINKLGKPFIIEIVLGIETLLPLMNLKKKLLDLQKWIKFRFWGSIN